MTDPDILLLPRIEHQILIIRGQKVMVDADLASLYGVPTKALNQAVKRNAARFPADFIFQLTETEKLEVVTNCDHLAKLKFSKSLGLLKLKKKPPFWTSGTITSAKPPEHSSSRCLRRSKH